VAALFVRLARTLRRSTPAAAVPTVPAGSMSVDRHPGTPPDDQKHLGERPLWTCRLCGDPWPCAEARRELLAEFRRFPSVLKIYMTAQMVDAVTDLGSGDGEPPRDLYARFLSWLPAGTGQRSA
jgi:hypothetical protein